MTTRTTAPFALLLLVLALFAAGCASGDDPVVEAPEDVAADTASTDAADGAETAGAGFAADLQLTGDAEVPGPGSDGTATAAVQLVDGELCVVGETEGVGPIVAGHLHEGVAAAAGGVVVDLGITTDGDGPVEGCGPVDETLAEEISTHPAAFYVNLHTAEFPDGAVRAQLG